MAKRKRKPAASTTSAAKAKAEPKQEWSPVQLAVQEAGRITGDTALKTEGQLEKHFGKVQAKYGDLKQDVKQSFK